MKRPYTTGYSLVEVLVAISVLLIAIVGPMTIASKGLQNAQLSRENGTATFLAQEGIETIIAMRNERALDFINGDTTNPWDWVFDTCDPDTNPLGCAITMNSSGDLLSGSAPATNVVEACSDLEDCRLDLRNTGRILYTAHAGGNSTPFIRQVFVDQINADQIEVTSRVRWDTQIVDAEREVEFVTVITNIYK